MTWNGKEGQNSAKLSVAAALSLLTWPGERTSVTCIDCGPHRHRYHIVPIESSGEVLRVIWQVFSATGRTSVVAGLIVERHITYFSF